MPNPVHVATGLEHSCAVYADDTAKCWGRNLFGQLGINSKVNKNAPTTVEELLPTHLGSLEVFRASAGASHSCILLSVDDESGLNTDVRCFGSNEFLQTGSSIASNAITTPISAGAYATARVVATGMQHSCLVRDNGSIVCWGRNQVGQLGDGTLDDHAASANVSVLTIAASDVATGNRHTCAITTASQVMCWGDDGEGQIGNGGLPSTVRSTDNIDPNPGEQAPTVSEMQSGSPITVAVETVKTVSIVPQPNGSADVTVDTTQSQRYSFPNTVVDEHGDPIQNAVKVTSGAAHSCALRSDGTVMCWGRNLSGQLGNNSLNSSNHAVAVRGLTNVMHISAGTNHTCAVTAARQVYCWGDNSGGQLGTGRVDRATQATLIGVTSAEMVSAGGSHTCALTSACKEDATKDVSSGCIKDSALYCWGRNLFGQLGTGTTVDQLTPTRIAE